MLPCQTRPRQWFHPKLVGFWETQVSDPPVQSLSRDLFFKYEIFLISIINLFLKGIITLLTWKIGLFSPRIASHAPVGRLYSWN